MPETYYDRLGVDPDATTAEIRAAYREALKEIHPDVSDDPGAADRTRRLVAAKEVLTDERERERYDRLGHEAYLGGGGGPAPPGTGESGSDGSDAAAAGTDPDAGGSRTRRTDAGRTTAGGRSGDATGGNADGRAASGTADTDRATRRARNRATRAAWNAGSADVGAADRADGRGGRSAAKSRRIYREDASRLGNRLFPPGESLVLLSAAFVLYPVMLWATIEPAFPLVVNLAVGLCLVLVVGFLLSMPSVGVAVFGAWSVLLPAGLALAAGVDLLSLVGGVAVAGTVVPLFLSLLTFAALRS